ncbi:MBL fold metallo-hydrolase [Oceanobacillus salinisoli]|uniref:MBL fold metallo-hydrolase n=1 Tax=Oceanobacillus salinisoli TaxID=2678611 RepID=UPI0012E2799E|nr:MBL fold metallo-hydrolase [Oceanobacillus salinisoli]
MIQVYERENVTCVEAKVALPSQNGIKVYVYLVDGMLVDTGPENLQKEFIPFFEENEFGFVILTHSHEDHSGNAQWIQQKLNKPIYVYEKGISVCQQSVPYGEYRKISWGNREKFSPLPLQNTIQSNHQEWEVIYTPGHASDHISIYDKLNGRMFTGDLFVSTKTKVIMRYESIPMIMKSIKKLLTYDFGAMFCSHSGYFKEGKKLLKQKLDFLEEVYDEVEKLYRKGYTISEMRNKLYPKQYPVIELSDGEINSLHIITFIIKDIEQ